MLKTIKMLNATSSILDIAILDDIILAIDNTYTLYRIDKESFNIKDSSNITSDYDPTHKYVKSSTIGSNGMINFAVAGTKQSLLINTRPKLDKVAIINTHIKPIESSKFAHNCDYLATGGIDGKLFIHDAASGEVITTFPNSPDYISTLRFSEEDSLLVSGCYNKTLSIYNMDKFSRQIALRTPDVLEDATFIDHNKRIFMVCRNGASLIYNLADKKLEHTANNFSNWPTTITLSPSKEYAIVGTRSNALYVIKLEDNSVKLKTNLPSSGINAIRFVSNYIIIGFSDGAIQVYDYNDGIKDLTYYLEQEDYKMAKEVLDQNIFLSLDPVSSKFDEAWEGVLQKAVIMLKKGEIEEAVEFCAPFLDDEIRAKEFDFYTKSIDKVSKLQELIDEKEFIKGYAYSEQFPYLKKLYIYNQLEDHWRQVFNHVRRLVEENPVYNTPKAEEILKPYFKVAAKKELVVNVLSNFDKFAFAQKYVKERNFAKYFALCKQFPFLEGTELYTKVQAVGEKLYSDLLTMEQKGEYKKASELIKLLISFSQYREKIDDIVMDMKYKSKFIEAVNADSTAQAYDILSHYDKARFLPEFLKLNKAFQSALHDAKRYGFEGDVVNTKRVVAPYVKIEYTSDKVANYIKIAYLNEIKKANPKSVNWKATITTLMNLFGKSEDIIYACKKIPLALNALMEIEVSGNPNGYKEGLLPDTVITPAL
jgi:hypothetical protein